MSEMIQTDENELLKKVLIEMNRLSLSIFALEEAFAALRAQVSLLNDRLDNLKIRSTEGKFEKPHDHQIDYVGTKMELNVTTKRREAL